MNVLVFSSAMVDPDFSDYQTNAKIKPNPSNQNFYSKLIKCLSLKNNVSVISLRPFRKGMFKENYLDDEVNTSGPTTFYYTHVEGGKIYKLLRETNEIVRTAVSAVENFHSNNFIIVTDTLRINLLRAAKRVGKMYGVKVVGMITDNPENLSYTNHAYTRKIKKLVSSLDGYLSLTSGLVDVFNSDKPSYVFEGLAADENPFRKDPIYDYYFFGGSLYERYGVKTLIDAFHESNIKSKLVIAGSGPLAKYIEQVSLSDYRILYLTQLPKERVIAYEKNAIANINPRPINKKLDSESVPSKLIEYLSVGVPVISTKFEKLYGTFKDDVIWIEGNDVESLKTALEAFDKADKEIANKKASSARLKVFEFYGLNVQSESITHFLTSINSWASNSVNFSIEKFSSK